MSQSYLPTSELPERLLKFTVESLGWCMKESETSAQTIMHAIESLLKKTERVASISSESLNALVSLKDTLGQHFAEEQKIKPVEHLLESLEALSREHKEVGVVIEPIIEALQFQDLLRQNLENIIKMMTQWIDLRGRSSGKVTTMLELGEVLLKCTTTVAERDVVRQFITGLPSEESVEAKVAMF
jgi:hypothetical protein